MAKTTILKRRCVSCDTTMTVEEMRAVKHNGEPEDMCFKCLDTIRDDYDPHEYQFEKLTHGSKRFFRVPNGI